MMKKTQAFVYKWTEITTGKWYIGSRSRKGCNPSDGYVCSSKFVKKFIQENPSNWQRDIFLMVAPEDAIVYETSLLQELDAKNDPMSYNLHNGDGKFSMTGKTGWWKGKPSWNKGKKNVYSQTSLEKMSKSHEGQPGLKGAANGMFGKVPWNKDCITPAEVKEKISNTLKMQDRSGSANYFYGKTHTEESKKLMSISRKGRIPWNAGKKLGKQSPELIKKRIDAMILAKKNKLNKELV